ncbi:MAG: acyl carrier protein [Planctomycetota bacterium]|nr:MAG: acyl carrier protein [Planctomycetota bacterium]
MATDAQKQRVKEMLVEHLHLRMDPSEIGDDVPLFGDDGLGLDSVDAIEVVAGVEQEFGCSFASEEEARQHLASVNSLSAYLEAQGKL